MREKAALKGEKTHCTKYQNVDTCGEASQTTSLKSRYDAASTQQQEAPVNRFSSYRMTVLTNLVGSPLLVFLCLSSFPPPQLGSYFRISEAKVVHSSSSLWSRLSQLQISRKIRSKQERGTRGRSLLSHSATAPQREGR